MMTNSEMCIDALKLCKKTRMFIPANEYLDTAISALEENDKLKTEIEQLKSELEQSVKLPCKVGDKAWCITSDQYDYITEPIECTVNEISINIDNPSLLLFRIDSNDSTDGWTDTFPNMRIPNHMNIRRIDDFGKTVFITREEAERHLKGKVEE